MPVPIEIGHIYTSPAYGRVRVWGFYRHEVSLEAGVLFRPVSKVQSGPQHHALSLQQWAEAEFVKGEWVAPSIYETPNEFLAPWAKKSPAQGTGRKGR